MGMVESGYNKNLQSSTFFHVSYEAQTFRFQRNLKLDFHPHLLNYIIRVSDQEPDRQSRSGPSTSLYVLESGAEGVWMTQSSTSKYSGGPLNVRTFFKLFVTKSTKTLCPWMNKRISTLSVVTHHKMYVVCIRVVLLTVSEFQD